MSDEILRWLSEYPESSLDQEYYKAFIGNYTQIQ